MKRKKEKELEESGSLASDCTTKLQSSKQYSTGTKNQKYRSINRIESPGTNPRTDMTKEARTYSGGKTVSSINAAGKTGQLHGKE